jgi:hypothetical protein
MDFRKKNGKSHFHIFQIFLTNFLMNCEIIQGKAFTKLTERANKL